MVNEAIRNQSDDPLGLTKQKTIQTEDEINKYLGFINRWWIGIYRRSLYDVFF